MQTKLIIAAVVSAFAMPVVAAPNETPYALSAVHADFQAQLERVAERPDEIGAAARAAADLMGPHNAAQERVVLPVLGWAEAATSGRPVTANLPDRNSLAAAMSRLYDGDVVLVSVLVELYAAAEGAGEAGIAHLAETLIWHETADVELLYPAAVLVHSAIETPGMGVGPTGIRIGPGPIYGEHPVAMMGVGDPHERAAGN
jgi:hypothetical protein